MKTRLSFLNKLSSSWDLLQLPLFVRTFFNIVLQPSTFFKNYYGETVSRPHNFGSINNSSAEGSFSPVERSYLGPVKFSAYAIALSNIVFPLILIVGGASGVVSQDFQEFAQWAEKKGYLDGPSFTGISMIDGVIKDMLLLAVMYLLGALLYVFSFKKIPLAFATGYFFYLNAWSLVGSLCTLLIALAGFIVPVSAMGISTVIDTALFLVWVFFVFGFPILFWPRIFPIERQSIVLALLLGLISWVAILAVVLPILIPLPDVSTYPGFNRPL